MECPACGAEHDDAIRSCPLCGADLATLVPGAIVADRYEIRSFLGRGGMGSVYRALDRVLDEEVALKVQLAEAAGSPEAERRFRAEVKLARQVSHPNVCRLHDGGQRGASRWISMELVEGEDLAARLRRGPLEDDEAWDLALQAAEGLAAVHRAGVVHRDLKPANLMVDRSGRLRLMDFGIARPASAGDTGASGYAQGSPEYMSPEQARGRPADTRSDVYSLGIVVFELFTGSVPFRAESPVATLLRHLEASPPLDRLPAALRPVVGRALAKDPDERFADGATMARALAAARAGRPVPAARPRKTRRRLLALAAAALGLAALVWAFQAPWSGRSEAVAPDETLPSPTQASPDTPPVATERAPDAASPAPSSTPAPRPPDEVSGRNLEPARSSEPAAARVTAADQEPPASTPVSPPPEPTPMAPPALLPEPRAAEPPRTETEPPVKEEDGALLVVVRPWADVSVDGIPSGQTPLGRIPLPPGPHQVLLTHPDYRPYPRRVVIRPGETLRLVVDLRTDGVRRR